ncbi:hypothetical protein J2Z75_003949 [Rhizobium herbae]|uniref:6-phosphogluconate dehydrogenase NADP-binding domain-containing protein n=1 Tax=Rhizobium herbae TaxID=508661 RepID=A0ABS4ER54_9HYPH|nr:hypothetical protein [Rhizobium herbae]
MKPLGVGLIGTGYMGISCVLMANRAAWGRKGCIACRFMARRARSFLIRNAYEFELYQADGRRIEQTVQAMARSFLEKTWLDIV